MKVQKGNSRAILYIRSWYIDCRQDSQRYPSNDGTIRLSTDLVKGLI